MHTHYIYTFYNVHTDLLFVDSYVACILVICYIDTISYYRYTYNRQLNSYPHFFARILLVFGGMDIISYYMCIIIHVTHSLDGQKVLHKSMDITTASKIE